MAVKLMFCYMHESTGDSQYLWVYSMSSGEIGGLSFRLALSPISARSVGYS